MRALTITITLLALAVAGTALAQGTAVAPGDDIIVTTGVAFDYLTHQAASVSAVSVRMLRIGGLPTFSTTTFEMSLYKPGTAMPTSNALTVRSGITQVLLHRSYFDLWANTELGITKVDFATLGNFTGAVGISYDVGGAVTKGKYHVYFSPFLREVSITSLQVKPVYGIQIGTGFRKGE
jgi:hypothetical protein